MKKPVRVVTGIAYTATYSDHHAVTEDGVLACRGKHFDVNPGMDIYMNDLDRGSMRFGITCRTCLLRLRTGAARIDGATMPKEAPHV